MNMLLILPLTFAYHDVVYQDASQEWEKKISRARIKRLDIMYPNGLLSIEAYISKHFSNIDVRILDFNILISDLADNDDAILSMSRDDFWEYCLSLTQDFVPDIIGVSLMFCSMYEEFSLLADFLREKYGDSTIIAGGHLASSSYREIFQSTNSLDAVCYGEGEIPFVELISAMQQGNGNVYMESDDSWITRNKLFHSESFSPGNKFIYDLDEIPPYRFESLVKWEMYSVYAKNPVFRTDRKDDKVDFQMFTTRGCPGKCVFCASQHVHGHKVRYYSVERVKSDIMLYMRNYGIESITIFDDHFLSHKQRALEIMGFLVDNGITTHIANLSFFSIDKEIAIALKKTGDNEVGLALENANENTLKYIIHKPGSLPKAKKAVRILRDEGFLIRCNILVGFPGETKESIDEGVKGMLELECDWYLCFVASPLPGSELYEICKQGGYLVEGTDIYKIDYKKGVIQTPEFTADYIEKKVYEINLYVNFVKNYNMRVKKYDVALKFFELILTDVIDTHAFAYYFASLCARELDLSEKADRYRDKYYEALNKYPFWQEWVEHFHLVRI